MSCDCGQCRQHYRTLGIAFGIPEESAIEEAYRESVKQWHPDLYQDYASLRAEAEERFKQIQVAYRELKEHNTVAVESTAESVPAKSVPVKSAPVESIPVDSFFEKPKDRPSISFGGAPGCQTGPHFTPEAEEIIAHHLGRLGMALAIVDLSGARSQIRSYAQFLLIAELGIMSRDTRNIVSLLWYKDLGEINLIDKQGKPGMWQSLVGGSSSQSKYALEIYRSNGTLYYSISGQVDDSVKEVIYNFLLNRKLQTQS